MNIKFLLSNFDFKEEVSDQGKTLMKRRKYLRALLYGVLWVVLTFGKALFGQSAYNSSQVLAPLTDSGGPHGLWRWVRPSSVLRMIPLPCYGTRQDWETCRREI